MILTMIMMVVHSVCIYVCIFMADQTHSSQSQQTQNGQKSRPISNMASRHIIEQN